MPVVVYDTSSSLDSTVTSTLTWNHRCSGDHRALLVGIMVPTALATAVQNITYNGVTMTALTNTTAGSLSAFLYYQLAPTENTSAAIVASLSAAFASGGSNGGAISAWMVSQTTTAFVGTAASGISTTPSLAIAVPELGLAFGFVAAETGDNLTATNFAQRFSFSGTVRGRIGGSYPIGTASTYTLTAQNTVTNAAYAFVAAAISPLALSSAGAVGTHSVRQMLTRSKVDGFRSLEIRRRLDDSSGLYETNWLDITEDVKKWGNIRTELDSESFTTVRQGGVTLVCRNDLGQFDAPRNAGSYWSGYLTRYKTLVRVRAGFLSPTDGSEIPPEPQYTTDSTSTLFLGVLTEPIELNDHNEATLKVKPLTSLLEDVKASRLVVASAGAAGSGQLTASEYLGRMRDVTDGSSNFILRPFLSVTAWDVWPTSFTLTSLDTTTALDSQNCWEMAKKLAQSVNYGLWVDKVGTLRFAPKAAPTAVSFVLSGYPYVDTTYGHTVKTIQRSEEDLDVLFTRVRIKFLDTDTSTSYATAESSWAVGDSSTAWLYGERTLAIENTWMSSSTAAQVASTLLADLNQVVDRVELTTKFIPTLNILDRCQIAYDPQQGGGTLWDFFNWDEADWDPEIGSSFYFSGKDYKLIGMQQDLDKMDTRLTLREI